MFQKRFIYIYATILLLFKITLAHDNITQKAVQLTTTYETEQTNKILKVETDTQTTIFPINYITTKLFQEAVTNNSPKTQVTVETVSPETVLTNETTIYVSQMKLVNFDVAPVEVTKDLNSESNQSIKEIKAEFKEPIKAENESVINDKDKIAQDFKAVLNQSLKTINQEELPNLRSQDDLGSLTSKNQELPKRSQDDLRSRTSKNQELPKLLQDDLSSRTSKNQELPKRSQDDLSSRTWENQELPKRSQDDLRTLTPKNKEELSNLRPQDDQIASSKINQTFQEILAEINELPPLDSAMPNPLRSIKMSLNFGETKKITLDDSETILSNQFDPKMNSTVKGIMYHLKKLPSILGQNQNIDQIFKGMLNLGPDLVNTYQIIKDVNTKADKLIQQVISESNQLPQEGFDETTKDMMAPKVEAVTDPVWLGEGPHWDHNEQALYFVSIFDHTVHKYIPSTKTHTKAKLDGMPTFIIPIEGRKNHFAVGLNRSVVEIKWGGNDCAEVVRTIATVDDDNPNNRFNDAKADPRGRLFAGTMGYEYEPGKFHLKKGSLYRIDPDGSTHKMATNIDISNGLCWDVKEKAFYYADSFEYTIRKYDYDIETGDISNPRTVFKYSDHGLQGIVDGMTIDTDGNLWVANFDGYQVLKIDPRTSKLLQKVPIPALQVTSCTIGGPNFDILYVTTASMNRGEEQPPPRGATFAVTGLGVKGHPNVNVRLD